MTPDALFNLANLVAMGGWVLLLLAPLRRNALILAARIVGVVLALTYATLLGTSLLAGGGGDLDFSTLGGVTAMFARPEAVLVGWVHYLAFDLWVGAWQAERAPQDGVPHWLLVPCLFLTFLFGPVGLLLFVIARTVTARRLAR